MLHYETIGSATLQLLKYIQRCSGMENMRLSGGTALALQIGHRKSFDLDFFGDLELENDDLANILGPHGTVKKLKNTPSINIFLVNDIKVDFVKYKYPWLTSAVKEDGLALADMTDIGAMKLAAITGRGRKRDFYDLYFLLGRYSLSQLVEYYNDKYEDGSTFLLLKSINYFEDAENDMPPELFEQVSWEEVKDKISGAYDQYMKQL